MMHSVKLRHLEEEIMNTLKYFCIAGIVLLALGCPARSIFPLFNEKEIVFNKDLVGTWVGKDVLKIEQFGEKGYQAVLEEAPGPGKSGASTLYRLQLGKVGKYWFLDSTPAEDSKVDYHYLKAHLITKIRLEGDALYLATLEGDRLKELIDAGSLKISHVRSDNDILLTASPEELQKLVLRLADDEKAFKESPKWERKR
jgi:hypothetical protein